MEGVGEKFHKAANFIKQDVWRIPRNHLTPGKSFFLNLLRIIVLSVRRFGEDKCQLRASALTFYSLISIVPVLAMVFGIAKGFGMEKVLEDQLRESLVGHQEVFDKIVQFSHSLLQNTQGGLIAGIGLVTLFWAVIKVLGQMEYSFNDIWGIENQRSISRKFADFLSLMLICPVILILSSGVTVFVSTQLNIIMKRL
jgi:membrane protein